MKVFISWSGERSQVLARALKNWLPLALHYATPWLSEADVAAGERWAQEVAEELETSNFGIICVTPENVAAPWILFEAGALAKSMHGPRVIPLLYGLEFSDISGPLAQFQAKKADRDGVRDVVQSINGASPEEHIPEAQLQQLFTALWPQLESELASIPSDVPAERHVRPQHEILEEMVAGVRGLESRLRDFEAFMVSDEMTTRRRRGVGRIHPSQIEDLLHRLDPDNPTVLLAVASIIREDLPWLYELLLDVYRAFASKDQFEVQRALRRVQAAVHQMERLGPLAAPYDSDPRVVMEIPLLVDRALFPFRVAVGPVDDRSGLNESSRPFP